jgi:hypothetical protein
VIEGIEGAVPVLLSAGEIPRELAAGRIHLGVTGSDLVREQLGDDEVAEVAKLGFGQADLVIAVPNVWIDVETVDDLDAAAAAFRKAHGHRLRIATKYHRLVRDFLQAQGVADYQLVDSQGATEGTVLNGRRRRCRHTVRRDAAGEPSADSGGRLIHSSGRRCFGRRVAGSLEDRAGYGLVSKVGRSGFRSDGLS